MKQITQSTYTEGINPDTASLKNSLREFFNEQPFANGFDWQFQYYWANMTDEQALLFALKHPQFADKFKDIE